MHYTVYRKDGNTSSEFDTYARLLRQRGIDLGKLPRIPEPSTGKNWLYVWADPAAANDFRKEIAEQTDSDSWQVQPVNAASSEGPFGPLRVRLLRQQGQFVFTLDMLSRQLIRSAFPHAFGVSSMGIAASTYNAFKHERKDFFPALVRTIMPALTGLTADELNAVGYVVIDADTDQPLDHKLPSELSAA